MKMHIGISRPVRGGGTMFSTLCGRMNASSKDGMNIADRDEDATCSFCLRKAAVMRNCPTLPTPASAEPK